MSRRIALARTANLLLGLIAVLLIKPTYYEVTGSRITGGLKIIRDARGVPIVDYGYVSQVYIGKQRNPLTVSQTALDHYGRYQEGSESHRELFLNCAKWLVAHSVLYDNHAILEYKFPWPTYNMTSPWRSAMAQAVAMQVLTRAHTLTGDSTYLDTATKLLNSFFVGVEDGGITYLTSGDGWWYEEYADEQGDESRVLNGMMVTLLGIYEYHEYTDDPNAQYVFDQGLLALARSLPAYDDNGHSYYDVLGNRPSPKYHQLHVQLLGRLYDITGEHVLREYRDRWQTDEEAH